MKIYRLEIWCTTTDENGWCYHALSDFYADKTELEKLKSEFEAKYKSIDAKYPNPEVAWKVFDEWENWLSTKLVGSDGQEKILDTHAYMPEINEYDLIF